MRCSGSIGFALFAVATLQTAAVAAPLPDAGREILAPGFTIHSPGAPWSMQSYYPGQRKDGSLNGQFVLTFAVSATAKVDPLITYLRFGDDSNAVILVSGAVSAKQTGDLQSVADVLMRRMKERAETEPRESSRIHYVSSKLTPTVLNGAPCVRRDAAYEDRGVLHHEGDVFTFSLHEIMCANPEFPAFTARVEYSVRLAPGAKPFITDEAGLDVLNSLKFKHLGHRVSLIPVGYGPKGLAEADGALWVTYGGDRGYVARIDPKTNTVVARIPVGNHPIGIAADASGLWVANNGDSTVSHIDPAKNVVVATIPVPKAPQSVASGAGAIWVSASGAGSVLRIDPKSGKFIEISNVGTMPAGIAVVGGSVFVTDYRGDKILRIDPATNKVADTLSNAPFSNVIIADGQYLWANSMSPAAVLRHEHGAAKTAPVKFVLPDTDMPIGLASWSGKLWVANWGGASIAVRDPARPDASGELLPVGVGPVNFIVAQGALWITVLEAGNGYVLRFDPE